MVETFNSCAISQDALTAGQLCALRGEGCCLTRNRVLVLEALRGKGNYPGFAHRLHPVIAM
jgi:hypothetical protein